MKHSRILRACTLTLGALLMGQMSWAQSSDALDRIHIGVLGGIHLNKTSYSNLDELYFPNPSFATAGAGGIYAEFEFGQARHFSIRPELVFTNRNTAIHGIQNTTYTNGSSTVGELDYDIKAHYVDIRVPLMYNFGSYRSVRPYLFVAPILGFATGGNIKVEDALFVDELDVTKANMASTYFAAGIGAGVKFPIRVGSSALHIGLEASYELGLTNTYGSKEKKGWAVARNFYVPYDIVGTRKYHGFEITANVSIPLSIFKKSSGHVIQEPVVRQSETVIKEKPCYTLEEIVDFINKGRRISGLTICAIDIVNFEYSKSTLTSSSRKYLDKIVSLMSRSTISLEIKGHTDNKGTEEFNMELSRKRSKAVYDYLISKGVDSDRLTYSYYGETKPIANNATEEGRRMNRRVEFDIK